MIFMHRLSVDIFGEIKNPPNPPNPRIMEFPHTAQIIYQSIISVL
jgi:hypothetical protein